MLDFYLIQDDQAKPNNLEKSGIELVGRLDENTFEELQKEGIVDLRFDFYSTFRWDRMFVKQLQVRLESLNKQTDSTNNLKELLEKASKRQSGLIAYGD